MSRDFDIFNESADNNKCYLSLYELNNIVRQAIECALPNDVWVVAELAEGRQGSGGHFYGELVQKDASDRRIIARARMTIWARMYSMLSLRFTRETGETLRSGLKLLLRVSVTFHEQYGYSLNVLDIDPSYTLGDMARKRKEILRQLELDGIINDNKTLPLPTMLQRIAVVSSAHAAGYGDFCDQLTNNEYGLRFDIQLFPAIMQGERVEESILSALDAVLATSASGEDVEDVFDCVVIIRGGGATTDLSDFDSYPLAAAIAQFPLPVLVGIGHDRDETVLDYVANQSIKTPTAVAAFLIDHQAQLLLRLQEIEAQIPQWISNRLQQAHHLLELIEASLPVYLDKRLQQEYHRLALVETSLPALLSSSLQREHHRLEMLAASFPARAQMLLERRSNQLQLLEQRLKGLDPELLLQRGYSITTVGGMVLKDSSQVTEGDVIVTKLAHGELYSKVL